MKIHALLTSSSFSSDRIKTFFESLVVSQSYKKAVIVTTAHPKKEKSVWNIQTKIQLESAGLDCNFVDFEAGECVPIDTDVIYVCGGNTFRLLKYAKEVNFGEQIKRLFNTGGLYFGSSAGSIILSPDIYSAVDISPDKNIVNLTDFSAFNFIDFHIVPHYTEDFLDSVVEFEKAHDALVVKLRDGEAVYINGSEQRLLSID